ncbi:MAG: hypothetical protein M3Q49_20395 [Actinomycetota bacterium]|nr:hypothetical protein [Actinomycetota bacterium]
MALARPLGGVFVEERVEEHDRLKAAGRPVADAALTAAMTERLLEKYPRLRGRSRP